METNKTWLVCFVTGTIFGAILTTSGYILNYVCSSSSTLCYFNQLNERIIYFPTVYVFLSSAISFVNQNLLVTVLFFIIPILQYSMIGSIVGIVLMRRKNNEKED